MTPRDVLGELEEMVLLAALRLKTDAYGGSILKELDAKAGRDVPRGSVYLALERLAAKGFLTMQAGETTQGRRGRPRRMVTVTESGIDALRRVHAVRAKLSEGLAEIFPT